MKYDVRVKLPIISFGWNKNYKVTNYIHYYKCSACNSLDFKSYVESKRLLSKKSVSDRSDLSDKKLEMEKSLIITVLSTCGLDQILVPIRVSVGFGLRSGL